MVFTSKNLLGPGPRLIKKRIYRAAVSQRLRTTALVSRSNFGIYKLIPIPVALGRVKYVRCDGKGTIVDRSG
jgi:hypothetical protein